MAILAEQEGMDRGSFHVALLALLLLQPDSHLWGYHLNQPPMPMGLSLGIPGLLLWWQAPQKFPFMPIGASGLAGGLGGKKRPFMPVSHQSSYEICK